MTVKSNQAWDELCAIATRLFPKCGSRLAAFKQACLERPDLAGAAIDPTGAPVVSGSRAAHENAAESDGTVETAAGALGTAKPWGEVMRSLAVEAGEQQPAKKPAGDRSGALPWREVFTGIERAERGAR